MTLPVSPWIAGGCARPAESGARSTPYCRKSVLNVGVVLRLSSARACVVRLPRVLELPPKVPPLRDDQDFKIRGIPMSENGQSFLRTKSTSK